MTSDLIRSWASEFASVLSNASGLVPHLPHLFEAIGFFGLEPRVREIAALAVARSLGCPTVEGLHRIIGKAAGLTDGERAGHLEGLTAAELSAVALALGTVSRPLNKDLVTEPPDQHYAPEQIRQIQAIAVP